MLYIYSAYLVREQVNCGLRTVDIWDAKMCLSLTSSRARAMLNRQVCVSSTKNPLASLILGAPSPEKSA